MQRMSHLFWISVIAAIGLAGGHAAIANTQSLGLDYGLDCEKAAMALRSHETHALAQNRFTQPGTLQNESGKPITVLASASPRQQSHEMVAIVEQDSTTKSETPIVTVICLDKTNITTGERGAIRITVKSGDQFKMAFLINKKSDDAGYLPTADWLKKPGDSIWIKGPYADNSNHPKPQQTDWPDCLGGLKGKKVHLGPKKYGNALWIDFGGCRNDPSNPYYSYSLHLMKTVAGAEVPADIDPVIINKP